MQFLKEFDCRRSMQVEIVSPHHQTMKGEIINCSSHKDIYFLETNTKSESTNLANLFAPPPSGKELFKHKTRPKLKHKLNPALEFFIHNNNNKNNNDPNNSSNSSGEITSSKIVNKDENKCHSRNNSQALDNCRNRTSIDELYEEAASILGLTCTQTDDCKCIECQCHYFDFEDEMDYMVDHSSSCTIQ